MMVALCVLARSCHFRGYRILLCDSVLSKICLFDFGIYFAVVLFVNGLFDAYQIIVDGATLHSTTCMMQFCCNKIFCLAGNRTWLFKEAHRQVMDL